MDEISREVREKQRSHVTRETQRFGWEKPPEGARYDELQYRGPSQHAGFIPRNTQDPQFS